VVWGGGASRDRTDDLLLAKQALSQLSYGPRSVSLLDTLQQVVGLGGVEPPTSPLSGVRSNQLSYRPGFAHTCLRPDLESTPPECTGHQSFLQQVTCVGARAQRLTRSIKGGDPAARSRTATLLRLHPSH
jgi:hypothetical protein